MSSSFINFDYQIQQRYTRGTAAQLHTLQINQLKTVYQVKYMHSKIVVNHPHVAVQFPKASIARDLV